MALETHPLEGNEKWTFFQPNVGIKSHYLTREIEVDAPEEIVRSITHGSTCREGLINNVRAAFQALTTEKTSVGERAWQLEPKKTFDIVLDDEKIRGPGMSRLWIDARWLRPEDYDPASGGFDKKFRRIKLDEFLKVADIVVGLPAALLNPDRASGEWWRTDPEKALAGGRIYWDGADNTVLQHPAVMAVLTGLYRQAFCLCHGGFGPQILETGSYEEVRGAIDAAEWKPIFGQCEKFRPWINVPVPNGGYPQNFAFPWHPPKSKRVSYWQRFVRLQRALRRHGFNEVLGEDICSGWALLDKGTQYSGAYSFWGEEKKLTGAHKRVMQLGRPLKRKKKDDEEAQGAS